MKNKTVILITFLASSFLICIFCSDKDLLDTYQEASRVPIVTYLGPNNINYNLLSEGSPTVDSNIVLKIVFDMKMDSLSVQNALKLSIMNNNQPVPQDFMLFWRGQTEADIMIMQVDGILQPEKRYWIKLDLNAKTIYGRNIDTPIDIYFNINKDINDIFKVELVTPTTSGTSSVSYCGNNYVQIQFSKRTDQQTVVTGFKLYESGSLVNGNISPVNGFLDDKNFKYELNGGYIPNSVYTVVVDKSVLDKTEKPLEVEFTSTFTTIPTDSTIPTVSFIAPQNQSSPITLLFSEQMMYNNSLLNSIIISSSDGDVIPVTSSNSEYDASNKLKIQPPLLLKMSPVAYTIIVGTAGQDVGCNYLTGTNFTFSVIEADTTPPVVEMTTPVNGATDIGVNSNITIYFSEAMKQAETSNAVSLYQGTNLLSINTSWSAGDTLVITPVSALNLGNTYTIKISTSAQDISGNNLINVYVFSFNTVNPIQNIMPTGRITSPTDGQCLTSNIIIITGTANDSDGSIQSIELKVDNGNILTSGTTNWTGTSTSLSNAVHSISLVVYDNVGSSSILHNITISVNTSVTIPNGCFSFEGSWGGVVNCVSSGSAVGWQINNWTSCSAHIGTGIVWHDDFSQEQTSWLILPGVIASSTSSLSYWQALYYLSYTSIWQIRIGTGASQPACNTSNYALLSSVTKPGVTCSWTHNILSLNSYAGQMIWVAFYYSGNGQDNWFLDDICFSNTGDCFWQQSTSTYTSISIDGTNNDWESSSECLGNGGIASTHTSCITWDSNNLYIEMHNLDFSSYSDTCYEIYLDTNSTISGAQYDYDHDTGGNARAFPVGFRPDYLLIVQSGPSLKLTSASGTYWDVIGNITSSFSGNGGLGYIGTDATHQITEIKIPFSVLSVSASSTSIISVLLTLIAPSNDWIFGVWPTPSNGNNVDYEDNSYNFTSYYTFVVYCNEVPNNITNIKP